VLWLLIVGCAVLGLVVGSFLNVVIYRVPRKESIVSPGSACPTCGTPILGRDNIPVVSWMMLRGKCRTCRSPISPHYPLIELSCAALFGGAAARLGFQWDLPAMIVLLGGLLALACIDAEHLRLPKSIVYVVLAMLIVLLVLAAGLTHQWHRLLVAAICALAWFVAFFVLNFVSPRLLGFGDVRLSLVLGFGLGWFGVGYVLLGFFASNLIGAVIGVWLLATKKLSREQPIPYGVFLSLGTALAIYAGPELLAPFHGFGHG
jgi:leader peptidase (prepilin peptidase)/N-methyltransferase